MFSLDTNVLFATLLLGVQRLEETGVLPQAHQAMLEDMLEGWTGGDDTGRRVSYDYYSDSSGRIKFD